MKVCVIGLCALLACIPGMTAQITLVKDSAPRVAIYVAPDVMAPDIQVSTPPFAAVIREIGRRRLRESVADLALYLNRISGARIEIHTRQPAATDHLLPILIGGYAQEVFGPPARLSPLKQGWRLAINRHGIGMIGENDEATSYAIYELLDRLGCRWYMPGDMGEVIPGRRTITCPALDLSQVPATRARGIWYADAAYMRRNRLGGIQLRYGHGLEVGEGYLTKQQLEEHPEWNAEINGKRGINGRLCWGNPEVAAAIADAMIGRLDKDYVTSLSIFPEDGMSFCECAKCKALDAGDRDSSMGCVSLTDRYIHFVNQIAERVTKQYPDVLFAFCPYVQYTRPPVREKPHPNLVPIIAPITYCRAHSMRNRHCPSRLDLRAVVNGWAKVTPNLGFYEFSHNLADVSSPNPLITKWGDDLQILYRAGCNYWLPETQPTFDTELPGLYLGIRLSWYTTAKPGEIMDRFYTDFYGAAAKSMRRYWETFDRAWSAGTDHAGCAWSYNRRFSPELMALARAAIDDALRACQTPMELRRVKIADEALRVFELYMKMRRDFCAGQFAGLGDDLPGWKETMLAMGTKYKENYAFTLAAWAPKTICVEYFSYFYDRPYQDAIRINRECTLVTPALRRWRYATDTDGVGETRGWADAGFNDAGWKTTDPCVDTWSYLGLHDYFGRMWYRASVPVPAMPTGKKVYLWISSMDDKCSVFVNGQAIPYVDEKGQRLAQAEGFCKPVSFEITSALKPGAENSIAIRTTRDYLNEIGVGGLIGPVLIYRDR